MNKIACHYLPKKKSQQGQSIFEFLIFFPFLLILFFSFSVVGGAINSSINQQKAARGYFFKMTRGNSRIPTAGDIKAVGEASSV
ncbi:MAG: hypothetical protein WCG27_02000, partial [Pseudomonadota bacterium]